MYNVKQTGKNDYDILILLDICYTSLSYGMVFCPTILIEPMYDKLSNPWLTILARGIAKGE